MEIIALIITNILAPVITAIITWVLAKRKYNAEVDNNVISNMKLSLEFYKALSDDNRSRLNEVLAKNEQLERELSDLRNKVMTLTMLICMDLTCQSRVLAKSNKESDNKTIE